MDYINLVTSAAILPFIGMFFLYLLKRPVARIKEAPEMSIVVFCIVGTLLMTIASDVSALAGAPIWHALISAAVSSAIGVGILKVPRIRSTIT